MNMEEIGNQFYDHTVTRVYGPTSEVMVLTEDGRVHNVVTIDGDDGVLYLKCEEEEPK